MRFLSHTAFAHRQGEPYTGRSRDKSQNPVERMTLPFRESTDRLKEGMGTLQH
jgi:hypothetical protein